MYSQLVASIFLSSNINLGSRVIAHPDEREPGLHAAALQIRDPVGQLSEQLAGDGAAINEVIHPDGMPHPILILILIVILISEGLGIRLGSRLRSRLGGE